MLINPKGFAFALGILSVAGLIDHMSAPKRFAVVSSLQPWGVKCTSEMSSLPDLWETETYHTFSYCVHEGLKGTELLIRRYRVDGTVNEITLRSHEQSDVPYMEVWYQRFKDLDTLYKTLAKEPIGLHKSI